MVVLIRLRGAYCLCLLYLKLFLPSFLCIVILFLVCLLFLQCLFLQVPDSLLDSFFLLKFTLKSFQLLFLCLLSVQIWLGLQSLLQFFWIYASLNGFACFDVIIGEAWNLKFFGLISQAVNVHVINISDCKFRTWAINALMNVRGHTFSDNHFVQYVKYCGSLLWLNTQHFSD